MWCHIRASGKTNIQSCASGLPAEPTSRILRQIHVEHITTAPLRVSVLVVALGDDVHTALSPGSLGTLSLVNEEGLTIILLAVRIGDIETLSSNPNVIVAVSAWIHFGLFSTIDLYCAPLAVIVTYVSNVNIRFALLRSWANCNIFPIVCPGTRDFQACYMLSVLFDAIQYRTSTGIVVHPVEIVVNSACRQTRAFIHLRS
mmetsp:Transcript_63070/g.77162  ORF Transcript_63070/g.77162 Transcript_63070/m.77162 type:complete len:201 (-) Transcript_63070:262-864(-)